MGQEADVGAGAPLFARDTERRLFEAPWMHKLGPFTYRGHILRPVVGWTTHHSIVQFRGAWYLVYHDSTLSGGVTHKRCVKVTELHHQPDGSIRAIDPYG